MKHWRKMTWALIGWTVLMGIWIVAGAATASGDATNCGTLSQKACNDASNVGTGIGVALLVFLWGFGFVILSLVWFMTRPKNA
jgi:uncharacterized membrane protein